MLKRISSSVSYSLEKIAARFLVSRLRTWGHCDTKDYNDIELESGEKLIEYTPEMLVTGYGRCAVCMADDIATQLSNIYVLDNDDWSMATGKRK